jgi:hypothetical protein
MLAVTFLRGSVHIETPVSREITATALDICEAPKPLRYLALSVFAPTAGGVPAAASAFFGTDRARWPGQASPER